MRCPRPDIVNRLRAAITGLKFPRELYISEISEAFQEPKWVIELALMDMLKEGLITNNYYKNYPSRYWKQDRRDCDYHSMYFKTDYQGKKARICKYCDKLIKGRHQKLKHHDKHNCQLNSVQIILDK